MPEPRANRRLAAILAADVVGYSRLMEHDEAGTLAALKARRHDVLAPVVAQHHGRVVKVMGDGVLVEFGSAVDAVQCAVELQKGFTKANQGVPEPRHIILRIGINLGDVIVEGSDIYGDGVNVAARLEGLAEPGGILVSATVHDHVTGKLELAFDDLGVRTLKNIAKPVRIYRAGTGGTGERAARPALALPDKPSIAVLPFQNMSGDIEQEYFADGMVEEIITALSRFNALFVIARNSSFTYKGKAVDIKQVGRELGVRYVLEGSVRKAGHRVRITGQLIDAATGSHLWADRFDGTLEDVFVLQDQVTANVVGAIGPRVELAEIERAKRKPTDSLDAYDHYLRGLAGIHQWSRESIAEALSHFRRAIELDPHYATPFGLAARCYSQLKAMGWLTDGERDVAEAERLARRAAELGPRDAVALCTAGLTLAYVVGDFEEALALTDQALALNPNLGWAWYFGGWVKLWSGDPRTAIERLTQAMRLSPTDSELWGIQDAMSSAQFVIGDYEEAIKWAKAALRSKPDFSLSLIIVAAGNQLIGRPVEAQSAVEKLLASDPSLRISGLDEIFIELRQPKDFTRFATALRQAGLPE